MSDLAKPAKAKATKATGGGRVGAEPPDAGEPDWMRSDPLLRAATLEHYADPVLYDHEYRRRRADVNYYRRLAAGSIPPLLGRGPATRVLELGCGSGRLTVPLLRDGRRVVGVDLSMPMLRRLKERIDHLPPAARSRAQLVRADFRHFALGQRFPLVVCPFNAMQHLYTRADVAAFLERVREHLLPGGVFAFDVLNPDLRWLTRDPRHRWARTRFKDPRDGRVWFYSTNHDYDAATQINWIRLYYDPEPQPPSPAKARGKAAPAATARRSGAGRGAGEPTRRGAEEISPRAARGRVIHLAQRQFFPEELLALLESHGFVVEERDGGFDGEAFTAGSDSQVCRCSIPGGPRR